LAAFKEELTREMKNIYLDEVGVELLQQGDELKIKNSGELFYYKTR
jgi:hypothetical protein